MGKADRRAHAPPSYVFVAEDSPPRGQGLVTILMCVVVAAFAALVWSIYGGGDPPRIRAQGDYKVRPSPSAERQADPMEENAFYGALEGRVSIDDVRALPQPEEPLSGNEQATSRLPRWGPAPRFAPNGQFVAQIAAVRSERAAQEAWRRLRARAPSLFANARPDIERADLGAQGVYHRVRAGYFTDRTNGTLFCDRVKSIGQDCIVVAR